MLCTDYASVTQGLQPPSTSLRSLASMINQQPLPTSSHCLFVLCFFPLPDHSMPAQCSITAQSLISYNCRCTIQLDWEITYNQSLFVSFKVGRIATKLSCIFPNTILLIAKWLAIDQQLVGDHLETDHRLGIEWLVIITCLPIAKTNWR